MKVSVIVKSNKNKSDQDIEILKADTTKDINEKIENCESDYILSVKDFCNINGDTIERGINILKNNPEIGIVYEQNKDSRGKKLPKIMLFRKEDFVNAGKYKTYLSDGAEDYDLWITLSEQGLDSYQLN